jgi:hypothetical protein
LPNRSDHSTAPHNSWRINTSIIPEESTMPQIIEPDYLDRQRETIRQSLNVITNDIGMALRDAGLTFPVFITVPNSGDSMATIATPIDPSDEDWSRAMAIVCRVIQKTIQSGKLRNRALACTAINTAMTCADVGAE